MALLLIIFLLVLSCALAWDPMITLYVGGTFVMLLVVGPVLAPEGEGTAYAAIFGGAWLILFPFAWYLVSRLLKNRRKD
jgi:hypothetical protein